MRVCDMMFSRQDMPRECAGRPGRLGPTAPRRDLARAGSGDTGSGRESHELLALEDVKNEACMAGGDNKELKKIGLDIANFSRLRNEGYVYVDKTEFVHRILTGPLPHVFLSRPRRFGKTLLIDTLEEAAIGRKELFSDLAIDDMRGEEDWPRSHVLRISMSSFGDDPVSLDRKLTDYLHLFAQKRGFDIPGQNSDDSLYQVIDFISSNFDNVPLVTRKIRRQDGLTADRMKLVVLIDEYDAPIINNITDIKRVEIAKETLHGFYNALKSCEEMIDRIFITGITKFSQLSLFSALNNLEDISFDPEYSTVCGFTFDEINNFYSPNIDACLDIMQNDKKFGLGFTKNKLIDRLREWYDGYSWDGDIHVINPLSFQKFLNTHNFGNFWSQTGGTNLINKMNLKEDIFHSVFKRKARFSGSISIQDVGKIDPIALMLLTGYLTVRSQKITNTASKLVLTIPNREVGMTVMEEYVKSRVLPFISGIKDGFTPQKCRDFCEAFCLCDNETAEKLLHGIFSVIPYQLHLEYEAFYHVILLSIFRATDFTDNFDIVAESSKSDGIVDLVIIAPKYGVFVAEIKYFRSSDETQDSSSDGGPDNSELKINPLAVKDDRNLDNSIKDAFAQIIEKGYMSPYLTGDLPVYAAAIAVCGRNRVRIRSMHGEELLARASEYQNRR
jgi:hypothetical protein